MCRTQFVIKLLLGDDKKVVSFVHKSFVQNEFLLFSAKKIQFVLTEQIQ